MINPLGMQTNFQTWAYLATLFYCLLSGRDAAAISSTPKDVTIGVYINDIQQLDLKDHNFTADLYVWFRWKDPGLDPSSTFEYSNPYELWGHSTKPNYEKTVRLPNGEYYQAVRTHGRFSQKFALDNYPFDRQELEVLIEDSRYEANLIRFVPDKNSISINPSLRLPGFAIGKPTLTIVEHEYATNFGDLRLSGGNATFSRVRVVLPLNRPFMPYAVKFLLPILCVICAAGLMFLFNPNYVDSRVGIGVTALLTIVALQITLNEDLPEINYLVLIDKIYLMAYLYVLFGLGIIVKTTYMIEDGPKSFARAIRINRIGLAILTLLYVGSIVLFLIPVIR